MFENSLTLVDDAGLSALHVFGFSPRKGTPASRMPQLPRALVKERAARLRARGDAARARRLDALRGTRQAVLVEKARFGRTPCFAGVEFGGGASPGSIVAVKVSGARDGHLSGEISP
jgi:threonylcarbamoyladenosine tRNA methylthiotransferase MtaB